MAVNDAFVQGASDKSLNLKIADTSTNKEYQSPEVPDTQHATRNKPTASSLTLSNPMVYAAIHQFGLPMKNGRNMPWRPFFPLQRNGQPTAFAQREMERVAIDAAKGQ